MRNHRKKFWKSLIFVLLCALALFAFVGCRHNEEQEPPATGDGTTEAAVTGDPIARKTFTFREIGLFARSFATADEKVAAAVPGTQGNSILVYGYGAGETTVTAYDFWGNEATFDVTVKGENDMEVRVQKFSDEKSVNVRFFGAIGSGTQDDTKAIQSAIDSLKETGGTVYFPAGEYPVSQLILHENISLMLEGRVENVKDGYTKELAQRVKNGEFAIIRHMLVNSNLILNHDPSGSGADGASNISIIGGMIDLNGAIEGGGQIDTEQLGPKAGKNMTGTCALVFSGAENLLVENVIFKDTYNGHAMQLCGARNMKVIDCMFAGFTIRSQVKGSKANIVLTRETIQVEYAHSGAIPPSSYEPGEYDYCLNTEIRGCYFGKSDISGYQMTPIGQHGQNKYPNVTGFEVCDNVFDNPYYCALRFAGMVQMKIEGNRFISNRSSGYLTGYMIEMNCHDNNVVYKGTTKGGLATNVIYSYGYEKQGCRYISIRDNEFTIENGSCKRLLHVASTSYTPGALTETQVVRQVPGTLYGRTYSGFVCVDNVIRDVDFCDNRIRIGKVTYSDFFVCLVSGRNITVSGNEINSDKSFSESFEGVNGVRASGVVNGLEAKTVLFSTKRTGSDIILKAADGSEIRFRSSADGTLRNLTLKATEGIAELKYEVDTDGNVRITVVCEGGYRFTGWQGPAGVSLTGTIAMGADMTLTALCAAVK